MKRYTHALGLICALITTGCLDAPTEVDKPVSLAVQPGTLTLTYMCGNTFRVRNTNDTTVPVTWDVYKTTETGALSLAPKPAGQAYSESFFTTVNKGTVRLFSGGQLVQTKANGNKACATPRRLRIVLGAGVVGSPATPDTTYASGSAVAYSFSAAPGYQNVAALLDTILVAAAGTITMNGDHNLLVTADSVVAMESADQPILDGLRSLLTAADPVVAYEAHLARVDALYRAVGIEEASRRLNIVEYLAIDPVRDEAALRRVDAALANHVFDLPGANGSLSRAGVKAAAAQSAAAPSDSVTFIFVNGIFNDDQQAAAATANLRLVVQGLAILLPNVRVRHFYNRTYSDQGGNLVQREARCMAGAGRAINLVGLVTAIRLFADCDGRTVADLLRTLDDVEAIRQWLTVSGTLSPSLETDAIALGNVLQAERDQGHHVIAVPHSQGNLMVQQAVGFLRANGRDSANSQPCMGAVSLAAPTSANWPLDFDKLKGIVVKGDAILFLPQVFPLLFAPNEFPQYETTLTRKADEQVALVSALFAPIGVLARAYWSIKLHDAIDSYLAQAESRFQIESNLLKVYQACAATQVFVSPSRLSREVGQSVQLDVSVFNGLGEPLANRVVTWSSSNPTVASVDSTGLVQVLALGSATITAVTGRARATAAVQVIEPSPFPPGVTVFGTWFRVVQPSSGGSCDQTLTISLGARLTHDCHDGSPGITQFNTSEVAPFIQTVLAPLGSSDRWRLALAGDGNVLEGKVERFPSDPNATPVSFTRVQ